MRQSSILKNAIGVKKEIVFFANVPLLTAVVLLGFCFSPGVPEAKSTAVPLPKIHPVKRLPDEKPVTVEQQADQLEYDDKTKLMQLKGHVHLTQADMLLEGDAATYDLNREEADATGNLKLTRPDGVLTGHHLHLYYRDKRVFVEGNVSLVRFPPKEAKPRDAGLLEEKPVHLTADELEYSWREKIAVARGNVTLIQGDRKANADHGTYNEPESRLEMEGHVHLFRPPKDELECDHLVYNLKTDQAKADGHVHGKFLVRPAKTQAPSPPAGSPSSSPPPAGPEARNNP